MFSCDAQWLTPQLLPAKVSTSSRFSGVLHQLKQLQSSATEALTSTLGSEGVTDKSAPEPWRYPVVTEANPVLGINLANEEGYEPGEGLAGLAALGFQPEGVVVPEGGSAPALDEDAELDVSGT